MRPIHGLVIEVKGSSLTIELETGRIIKHHRVVGLKKYSKCLVGYDFTRNKISAVWPDTGKTEIDDGLTGEDAKFGKKIFDEGEGEGQGLDDLDPSIFRYL